MLYCPRYFHRVAQTCNFVIFLRILLNVIQIYQASRSLSAIAELLVCLCYTDVLTFHLSKMLLQHCTIITQKLV